MGRCTGTLPNSGITVKLPLPKPRCTKKKQVDESNPTRQLEKTDVGCTAGVALMTLSWGQIAALVRLEADGVADQSELDQLSSDPIRWRNVLTDLIEDLEDRMQSVRC